MTTSAVTVRLPLSAVLGVQAAVLAAAVVLVPLLSAWWPVVVVAVVVTAAAALRIHGRSLFGWLVTGGRAARQSRRRTVTVGAAVDVPMTTGVCGVRADGAEVVTVIALYGRPYALTLLRGSGISLSTNRLGLTDLVDFLDQPGGVRIRVDVVNAGRRVRRAGGYAQLYSTMLADRSAADIDSYLIVRMDVAESVSGLAYRESLGAAAAAATERIVNELNHRGVRAAALNAAEADALVSTLASGLVATPKPDALDEARAGSSRWRRRRSGPVAPAGMTARQAAAERTQVSWRGVSTKRGHLTTYYLAPEEISTASINQAWALRNDEVVQTISLWRAHVDGAGAVGPVMVAVTVQTCEPHAPQHPPLLNLHTLPGEQYAGALRAAPIRRPDLVVPALPLTQTRGGGPVVAIGATGILVGTALHDNPAATPPVRSDDLVMLALTDPARVTRMHMNVSDIYVRQLLLRAAAVGERIAIHTDRPQHWAGLTQVNIAVIGDRRPSFVPTVIVDDALAVPPSPGLAATVIRLSAEAGSVDDVRFVQLSPQAVRVSVGGEHTDVGIVEFRQEQAWLGLSA